ncbi:Gfo/Idh/MocA family protein [Algoriphagus machipongonensis]|uniref:Probable NADH-dependent dehydrogenase-putative NAD-employing oxidoreductase of the GFO family protein n=1 Tax=Algoriphagus machipongonensis TaxID=388413 RepID=A3HSH9_9BACT|nr:Gfo/Idh/MocA family oxidoreductase [Algoriphagus machipongonensis]EAZ82797.1 probable NADH-dependent dehydrogenase-putative NAD-employing oxidoreductase of the GFO family protein [Algoriphagus machipongonensis]
MTQRREFIKKSVLGTAGIAMAGMSMSAKSYASILGANERINLAVIGIRGQGSNHINQWCALKDNRNVRLKTLCDVDEQYFEPKSKVVIEKTGVTPLTEWDMKKVFDDSEIDAVSFAVPNHWHALGTIWACQAGKHVYVEKPASHNVWEGRKMVEAARKYDRRVQVGFQNRSIENVMEAMKFLHDGGIGDVYMARGTCYKPRDSFGKVADSTPPSSLHYDQWLGPAQYQPYNEKKVHYNWHWHWATGNGDTGNQGPHQFDVARWGLNKNEHPVSVYSSGAIYGITPEECSQETPNTQVSIFKYADGKTLEFETRGRYTNGEGDLGIHIGNVFYGTDGYLEVDGSTWRAYRQREKEPFAMSKKREAAPSSNNNLMAAPGGAEHYANFIDAIRAGNNETLHCDIEEGFVSSVLPLIANVSYLTGSQLMFDGKKEMFVDNKKADKLLTRDYRDQYAVPNKV